MRGIKKEKTPFVRVKSEKQETDLMVSNVDLLKQIAENTNKGNQLLSQLRTFFKKSDKKDLKVDKPFQYANKKLGLSVKKNKLEDNVVSIADNIQEIADFINELKGKDISRKDITSFTKISRKNESNNVTSLTKVNRKVGGDSLKNIELYTFKILTHLEKDSDKKSKKDGKAESKEIKITGLAKATQQFESIGNSIDKKAIRGLKTFQRQIEQMTEPKFIKNVTGLNAVLHNFSGKIAEISRQMSNAVISLKEFIRLIGLTAVSLMAPALEKGTKRFVDMFANVNSKIQENKKVTGPGITWKEMLVGLAIGLTAVVGSLLLVKFVSWKDVMKMLGFLAGLFGILSLFNISRRGIGHKNVVKNINRSRTGGTSIKGDNMLTAFAFGLAVLVIGLAAIREIDWKGPLIMVGFITALYAAIIIGNKLSGGVGPNKGMFGTALGVSLLVLAADAANEVFQKHELFDAFGFKIYGSPGTLGIITMVLALGLAARIGGGGGLRGMLGLSLAVGLLILCADAAGEVFVKTEERKILGVNWLGTVGTLGIIAFTYAMAGAIRYATGGKNPIGKYTVVYFVGSILAILYTVKRATKLVDKYGFNTVLGGAGVISGFTWIMSKVLADINIRMKGINKKGFLEKIGTMSLAILMLAGVVSLVMFVISKIDVSWNKLAQFGALSILMVGIFIGMNEYITRAKMTPAKVRNTRNTLLNIAGSFVALSIPMLILSEVDVSWKTMAQLGLSIIVLAGVAAAVGALDDIVTRGTKTMLKIAGSFAIMSISMRILSGVNVEWKTIGQMGAALLGLGLIAAALGIPVVAGLVGLGAGVLMALSASLLLVSLAMKKISESNISLKKVTNFVQSLKKLLQHIALITPAALVAMVGVVPISGVALASIAVAESLDKINKLTIDRKKITTFAESMKSLVKGINEVGLLDAIEAGKKSKEITKVAETSSKLGDSFKTIQEVNLQENTMPVFTKSIVELVDTFRTVKLDGIESQTQMISPVITAAKDYALALQSLQDVKIDETQTQAFCDSLGTFISTFSDELQITVGKMSQMEPGLEALSKIVSLPKQLAEGISSIANMNYIEYENKNGQLIEKDKRKLTDTEITKATTNFGTMLAALIEPINKLGSAKKGDIITIGKSSFTVAKKKQQENATELLKSIGESYQPFFDVTQSILDKAEILSDNTKSQNIIDNFGNLIGSLMTISDKLKKYQILEVEQTQRLKSFGEFSAAIKLNTAFEKDVTSYNRNSYNFFDNIVKIMERMESSTISAKSPKLDVINTFAEKLNNLKWDTINNGMTKVNKNVESIVKNINSLQLEKVIKFNDTLKYLSQNKTSDGIAECIAKIDELIGTIATYQEQEQNYKQAQITAEEESKALQKTIAAGAGKTIDSATLLAVLKTFANELQGLDVNAEIRNHEGAPIPVKVTEDWTNDTPNKFKSSN